jgi:hypothetical protein
VAFLIPASGRVGLASPSSITSHLTLSGQVLEEYHPRQSSTSSTSHITRASRSPASELCIRALWGYRRLRG